MHLLIAQRASLLLVRFGFESGRPDLDLYKYSTSQLFYIYICVCVYKVLYCTLSVILLLVGSLV